MDSNPTGEPINTATTDQLTGAAQEVRDLTEQTATDRPGEHARARRRTDGTTAPGAVDSGEVGVILQAERLLISRARYTTERVRFSKQIVTTTRTIEIPVRIEQLVISHEPFPTDTPAASSAVTLAATPANPPVSDLKAGAPAESPAGMEGEGQSDFIIVLHEEVPEFTLRVTPIERVTVGVRTVIAEQIITATLGSETISVDQQRVEQRVDQMDVEQLPVDPSTR